jgi:hypothetical protein
MINQHVHIYKCFQTHIVIVQQHVSAAPVTSIRVSYKKSAINIQIIVQKYVMKPSNFSVASLLAVKHQIIMSLKYRKIGCVYVVISRGFIIYFCTITCLLIAFNDSRCSEWNILVQNNNDMWLNILIINHIINPTKCINFSNLFWNESLHVSDNFFVHH